MAASTSSGPERTHRALLAKRCYHRSTGQRTNHNLVITLLEPALVPAASVLGV